MLACLILPYKSPRLCSFFIIFNHLSHWSWDWINAITLSSYLFIQPFAVSMLMSLFSKFFTPDQWVYSIFFYSHSFSAEISIYSLLMIMHSSNIWKCFLSISESSSKNIDTFFSSMTKGNFLIKMIFFECLEILIVWWKLYAIILRIYVMTFSYKDYWFLFYQIKLLAETFGSNMLGLFVFRSIPVCYWP